MRNDFLASGRPIAGCLSVSLFDTDPSNLSLLECVAGLLVGGYSGGCFQSRSCNPPETQHSTPINLR
jgi:hypothetical protein